MGNGRRGWRRRALRGRGGIIPDENAIRRNERRREKEKMKKKIYKLTQSLVGC